MCTSANKTQGPPVRFANLRFVVNVGLICQQVRKHRGHIIAQPLFHSWPSRVFNSLRASRRGRIQYKLWLMRVCCRPLTVFRSCDASPKVVVRTYVGHRAANKTKEPTVMYTVFDLLTWRFAIRSLRPDLIVIHVTWVRVLDAGAPVVCTLQKCRGATCKISPVTHQRLLTDSM